MLYHVFGKDKNGEPIDVYVDAKHETEARVLAEVKGVALVEDVVIGEDVADGSSPERAVRGSVYPRNKRIERAAWYGLSQRPVLTIAMGIFFGLSAYAVVTWVILLGAAGVLSLFR
jgi:hypothetical protein